MLIPLSSCSTTSWASIPGQSGSGWSRLPSRALTVLLDFSPLSSWVAQQSRPHPGVGSTCLEEITLLQSIAFPLAFWCKLMLTCVRDRRGHSRMFRCVRDPEGPPGTSASHAVHLVPSVFCVQALWLSQVPRPGLREPEAIKHGQWVWSGPWESTWYQE